MTNLIYLHCCSWVLHVAITCEPYAHPTTPFARRREANNTQKHFSWL